jgi:outer membrane protein, multidrug efflux system
VIRRYTLGAAAIAVAGCAVGPRYQAATPVGAGSRVGGAETSASARAFFDSVAAAHSADSAAAAGPPPPPDEHLDVGADLAWLDLLRDTTLVDLVRAGLRQNRDLQGALARVREFRAQIGVARAPLFPSVTANASAATNQIPIGGGTPIRFDALQVTGNLGWELDFWGRTRRGVEAAQAELGAEEAARQAVVLSLVSDISSAYLQLLELDQERIVAESTLAGRREMLALAQSRFRQGLTSELDVRQFEAQVTAPAAALADIERRRAEEEHRLSVLVGEMPRRVVRSSSLGAAAAALQVPDSIPASLLARRPDLRQAERAVAAATARIGVAQAARLPAVSITGAYGTQSPAFDDLFSSSSEVYQLQGGISIPLFTGGRLANETRVARARAEQARATYEQTALNALREAADALAGVRTAGDQVGAQLAQTVALRRALRLAELRYRSGVSNYLEVLEAQRGLFDAEIALSQAQLRRLTAAVLLYRALGGSWIE